MNERVCRVLCAIYRAYCRLFHPVSVSGRENVPAEGAVILCSNHTNLQDPMVLNAHLDRLFRFMAKKELFENRLLAGVMRALGAFPVSRGESDIYAVRESLRILKEGGALGIFPEGHRYTDGEIHAAEHGISLIALRSQSPVVPVCISGGYRAFRRVYVKIGAQVDLSDLGSRADSNTMREAAKRISDSIRALSR